jgi:hypothetical protein
VVHAGHDGAQVGVLGLFDLQHTHTHKMERNKAENGRGERGMRLSRALALFLSLFLSLC